MMDRLQDDYPDASIDHGWRTQQGEKWWKGYAGDKQNSANGRTAKIDVVSFFRESAGPPEHDWGHTLSKTKSIHRGMSIELPEDVHNIVHDSQQYSHEKRAKALLDHIQQGESGGLGKHWSVDEKVASNFAHGTHQAGRTKVVIHAHTPDVEHVETDRDKLAEHGIYRHDAWLGGAEKEIPLKDGAPVHVHSVTWYGPRNKKTKVELYSHDGHHTASRLDLVAFFRLAGEGEPLDNSGKMYYRFHHRDAPFGSEHAQSQGGVDAPQEGFSSFSNPHDLHHYLKKMDWLDPESAHEVDFDKRDVIGFRGKEVGKGIDGEPLVVPHSDKPDVKMDYPTFHQRLKVTPGKPTWDFDQAKRGSLDAVSFFKQADENYQLQYHRGGSNGRMATVQDGFTFRHDASPTGGIHALYAHHPDGGSRGDVSDYAGHIAWSGKDGEVALVNVHPKFQRRGLGTELWNRAKEVEPNLHHSPEEFQTDEGKAWAGKTASATTIYYLHNTEKSPDAGSRFGQDVEPHGRYLVEAGPNAKSDERWEKGSVTFQNPKHIPFGGGYQEDSNWKHQLSKEHGGKRGSELSQAVRDAGHDGIITHDDYGTSEIVDLTHLKPRSAGAALPQDIRFHFTPSWHKTKPHRISATVPDGDARKEIGHMEWNPQHGLVDFVHTDPEHRRKGIGSALWQRGTAAAEQHGVTPPQHSDVQTPAGSAWSQKADEGDSSGHQVEHVPPPAPAHHDLAEHMIHEHNLGNSKDLIRNKMTPNEVQGWHEKLQPYDPCTFGKTAAEYVHEHEWLPEARIFSPTKPGEDPRLFDGDHLKPEVRSFLLEEIGQDWDSLYADWPAWSTVYFAGGEASSWYGSHAAHGEGAGEADDFDVLVGVDFDAFRKAQPAYAALSDEQVADRLNQAFRAGIDKRLEDTEIPGVEGRYGITAYVNVAGRDIHEIKPYAAYNVSDDEWTVEPYSTPEDWSARSLPESYWDALEGLVGFVDGIRAMPEPYRTREGAALFDRLHDDRRNAFGQNGTGVFDFANVAWKYLDLHPGHPLDFLLDCKRNVQGKTASWQDHYDEGDVCSCCGGTGEHSCGHECVRCDADGRESGASGPIWRGDHDEAKLTVCASAEEVVRHEVGKQQVHQLTYPGGRSEDLCPTHYHLRQEHDSAARSLSYDTGLLDEGQRSPDQSIGSGLPPAHQGRCADCTKVQNDSTELPWKQRPKPTDQVPDRMSPFTPHKKPEPFPRHVAPFTPLRQSENRVLTVPPDGSPEPSGIMIAVKPPDEIIQSLVVEGGETPENLHITVAYLGNTMDHSQDQLDDLVETVTSWAETYEPFEARTQGAGTFVNDGSHVLWAAVDAPALTRMHVELVDYLGEHGYAPHQDHSFTPHITLKYDKYHVRFLPKIEPADWLVRELWVAIGGRWESVSLG
jgi:2'-5' RNA ligase